jgi:nitrous oxide reductase accessory protein NosL
MNRRHFLVASSMALAVASLAACKKEARCKHCGMRIDPSSAWLSELVGEDGTITSFDTPRCALTSWRSGATPARTIRVLEYYDRAARDGNAVRFVIGGDVVGPMGADLVPVDPPRSSKFIQDHGADRALRLDEVTMQVLANIGGGGVK